jgi:broad specificity phosphatase PhoE
VLISAAVFARDHNKSSGSLANAVILIIRHAEKPDSGSGLSPTGQERAKAYVNYFKNLAPDDQPLKINHIFAAADSKESHRSRLTIEPTARALRLPIDSRFKDKDVDGLAGEIRNKCSGQNVLIVWHHGEIPSLLRALGANAQGVIPGGKWPADVYGWLIELRYDAKGQLVKTRRINEKLMPDDSSKHSDKS